VYFWLQDENYIRLLKTRISFEKSGYFGPVTSMLTGAISKQGMPGKFDQ
jgi:hypothetical protein